MIVEFRSEIDSTLSKVTRWKRIALMASCCEPMLANYRLYQREYKRGDFVALRLALNALWDSALLESPTPYSNQAFRKVYSQNPPGWKTREMSALEDVACHTCAAIGYSMEYDSDGIEDVCDAALWAVLSGRDLPSATRYRDLPQPARDLLQQEIQRQRACLDRIMAASDSSKAETIFLLRQEGATAQPSILPTAAIGLGTALIDEESDSVK